MANSRFICAVAVITVIVIATVDAGEDYGSTLGFVRTGEFEVDVDTRRRSILAVDIYISYAALLPDSVPCSRRGASYYNCLIGAQANPYTRGCSAITMCRS